MPAKKKVYTKPWKTIEDNKIRHVWATPDGKREITVEPSWYQHNGTPVCDYDDQDADGNSFDGEDMIYIRTEILE